MDLTDILRALTGSGVVGVVGVFGGEGGSCCDGVSVHDEDLREREKKNLESELSELKVLLLLPGLGPKIAHDRLLDRGGVCVCSGRTMEEEADGGDARLLVYIFCCFSHSRYGFQTEHR